MRALPVGLFETDPDGRVTAANPAFCDLVQCTPTSVVGTAPWANANPADRSAAEAAWHEAVSAGQPVRIGFRIWLDRGSTVWVRLDAVPVRGADGTLLGYSGSALDHTDDLSRRLLLDRMQGVVGAGGDPVIILDRNDSPLFTNEAALRLFGVDDDMELVRDPAAHGLLRAVRDQVPLEVLRATTTTSWSGEVGLRGPDGIERSLDVDLLFHRADDGTVDYWGGTFHDITAARQLQHELQRQANHDALTGLPNRMLLLRRAAEVIDGIRDTRRRVAILFMDVDRLKEVNDTVGHEVGDGLLVQVANRIAHATRPSDTVARIGGDEFVVLCDGDIDEHRALEVAERIRHALTGRAMIHGIEIELSVSIGIAVAASAHVQQMTGAEAAVELLRNADIAMYQAKRSGRSRSEVYTEAMRAEAVQHKELTNALERALAAGQMRVEYQPIMSTHSGRVVGAEALLRWDHPARGTLHPDEFLHLAEASGAIVPIGDWVVRQACEDTRGWIDSGIVDRSFSVHVNISSRQLVETTFVERVLATVRQTELSPQQLTFDFDESTMNDRHPGITRSLQALRRFGVRLALDSFGTGVSSLNALRTCEADVLKLDGGEARRLGLSGDDDPVVRAIVQLAHALDMQVVAEWVTTPDQLRRLRMLGCDLVQGNLVGMPTGAESFADLVRR